MASDDLLLYRPPTLSFTEGTSPSFFTDLRLLIEKETLHWPMCRGGERHLKFLSTRLRQLIVELNAEIPFRDPAARAIDHG
jgi:hypothetical protein